MNKICDSLINFEITRDDLLKQDEKEVDLTTEEMYSPAKKTKLEQMGTSNNYKAKKQKKKKLVMAKVEEEKRQA